jgi:hypothetical protein
VPAEALEIHQGPAFTLDDLLDLDEALEREDWMDDLLGRPRA